MRKLTVAAFLICLFLSPTVWPQQKPTPPPDDWHKRIFAATPDEVYQAGLTVIRARHEFESSDAKDRFIRFKIGTTAWSWGYTMTLILHGAPDGKCEAEMQITKKGGSAVSWGSGSKETKKIWNWIEEEIARRRKEKQ